MKQKVLIFGAGGMLGRELVRAFAGDAYEVTAPSHDEADITDHRSVSRIIHDTQPEIVLNAAVLVNVDQCEAEPARAYAINADGPVFIAKTLRTQGHNNMLFVHFSSSDVFGGTIDSAPTEDEEKFSPMNVYGRSKQQAEVGVRKLLENGPIPFYIIRSSWIFSEFKKTFVDGIAEHVLKPKGVLPVANDQRGIPTWGKDIARVTRQLIEERSPAGVYHVVEGTDGTAPTRFEVAEEIAKILDRDSKHLFAKASRKEVFKAPRPASSALTNTKLPKLPHWKDVLRTFLTEKYLQGSASGRIHA